MAGHRTRAAFGCRAGTITDHGPLADARGFRALRIPRLGITYSVLPIADFDAQGFRAPGRVFRAPGIAYSVPRTAYSAPHNVAPHVSKGKCFNLPLASQRLSLL
jgi:hypothetical protein